MRTDDRVFSATDALLFYFFWEAMLIPMFLIIGIWGGPRRVYATLKFFLYTSWAPSSSGGAHLHVCEGGRLSIAASSGCRSPCGAALDLVAFLAAFAVKVADVARAHVVAGCSRGGADGGSVILAAIMLKMGGYGFLRFSLPIAPDASRELDMLLISLSLIAVVYIGFVAIVQQDMKKLIAYSSITHMACDSRVFPCVRHRQGHR